MKRHKRQSNTISEFNVESTLQLIHYMYTKILASM